MDSIRNTIDATLQPLDNVNTWIQTNSGLIQNIDEAVDLIDPRELKPRILFMMILLCFATGIGAWGGFSSPPKVFSKLTKYTSFRFFLMFLLIWQGGGGINIFVSFFGAVTFTLFDYLLNRYDDELIALLGLED